MFRKTCESGFNKARELTTICYFHLSYINPLYIQKLTNFANITNIAGIRNYSTIPCPISLIWKLSDSKLKVDLKRLRKMLYSQLYLPEINALYIKKKICNVCKFNIAKIGHSLFHVSSTAIWKRFDSNVKVDLTTQGNVL